MERAYYSNSVRGFLSESDDTVLGKLARSHQFGLDELQKNTWLEQFPILRRALEQFSVGSIILEFSIPRMGRRIDTVLILGSQVIVIEFKVGATTFDKSSMDQVLDYCLDLKNFHEPSHDASIIPVLIATAAEPVYNNLRFSDDRIAEVLLVGKDSLTETLEVVLEVDGEALIDATTWGEGRYKPIPTIIEAAQALYGGHSVHAIATSEAGGDNLSSTSNAISDVIDHCKLNNSKAICFVTGVPGAGKTLAGLNIANQRHEAHKEEHAVFLSGNGPLVKVLQEALARDNVEKSKQRGESLSLETARSKTKAFIQNIHHFRDDAIQSTMAPIERVTIFDEAQRAWTLEATREFMKRKKGKPNFEQSEPSFLIGVMNRHTGWAVIVCLVGGGQEINKGEAGITEWLRALSEYDAWSVHASPNLLRDVGMEEYGIPEDFDRIRIRTDEALHLSVSMRSFRSEKVSTFVKQLLDLQPEEASASLRSIVVRFPILITRDLKTAREWLRNKRRGTERSGIIASSSGYRLKPLGLHVKAEIDPVKWFLKDRSDTRSSDFLEDVATQFEVQGLELDWACIAWDADLRYVENRWEYWDFRGSSWTRRNTEERQRYLLNAYRVLLTRARQGIVIFIPEGSSDDDTRRHEYYDGIYRYLRLIGIQEIE